MVLNKKGRLVKDESLFIFIYDFVGRYLVPINISYWWNFGFLSVFALAVQIITGIFLAMHYIPSALMAFDSVEHIMRDVNFGWFLRYAHANGASMFFIVVFLHVFRGLYYGSYKSPRGHVWSIGVIILLLMIITAFLGYVLPWGQMSFWAATVITNLASAIPVIGVNIVQWLWGGFSVDAATLNRFFSLHYLLPFVIAALVFIHLILLHESGSSTPLGVGNLGNLDKKPFTPYFLLKDFYTIIIFLFFFSYFIFFNPNVLGHPDNYIKANPLVTPAHIVPEWYFLFFYAILRSVPDKLGGVILLLASLLVLLYLPWSVGFLLRNKDRRSNNFKPLERKGFWFFLVFSFLLSWIGGKPIAYPFYNLGQYLTFFYFFYILFLLRFLRLVDNFTLNILKKFNLV